MRAFLVFISFVAGFASALAAPQLTRNDVETIMAQAVSRAAEISPDSVIAITDREGYVLGAWDVNGGRAPTNGSLTDFQDFLFAGAVSRAGTAAFLSSDQNAFTSRTAGFIIQQHFPPKVRNTPNGPLVGVGLSNAYLLPDGSITPGKSGAHSDVNFLKQIPTDATGTFDPNIAFAELAAAGVFSPGIFGAGIFTKTDHSAIAPGMTNSGLPGIPGTSLNDPPGGVPLYKDGHLVGGIGVTGNGAPTDVSTGAALIFRKLQRRATPGFTEGPTPDEDVALAGQTGYEPPPEIRATNVLIAGIRIPYVESTTRLGSVKALGEIGNPILGFPIQASPPPFDYPIATLGGVRGEIRFPFRGDPNPGKIGKAKRLTKEEVEGIISLAAERSGRTRAGIRVPLPLPARVFIAVVGNPNRDDAKPPILGVFRTDDATIFSWDVAVQKARTALFFSTKEFAQSSRTVGFLAQRYYPPGLDGRAPGPYFGLQEAFLIGAFHRHGNPNVPNGITIFPGGFPLYRNGELIGAIGISGDGVDQDDLIGISGCQNFLPPRNVRADRYLYRGARLPYVKFPRDPDL